MGFVYDILKRHSNTFKVIKIVEWLFPNDIAEIKTFIKMTVYYRIFIKNFTLVATPIYFLIKKRIRFA
jgi:transcription elongation factor GreA-like protein